MDADKLLLQCEDVLSCYKPASSGRYVLYAANRRIGLEEWVRGRERKHRIALLSSTDINNGLSSPRWNRIYDRIRQLKLEKIL